MAEYKLQLLRQDNPFDSKDDAIAFLDSYEYHATAQPIVVFYYDNDLKDTVSTLFAVGLPTPVVESGSLKTYEIINSKDFYAYWHEVSGSSMTQTVEFIPVITDEETYESISHLSQCVYFVDSDDDTCDIYVGETLYASTSADKIQCTAVIGEEEITDSVSTIINKLADSIGDIDVAWDKIKNIPTAVEELANGTVTYLQASNNLSDLENTSDAVKNLLPDPKEGYCVSCKSGQIVWTPLTVKWSGTTEEAVIWKGSTDDFTSITKDENTLYIVYSGTKMGVYLGEHLIAAAAAASLEGGDGINIDVETSTISVNASDEFKFIDKQMYLVAMTADEIKNICK